MDSQGLLDALDVDGDGTVTEDELASNPIVADLLQPDVDVLGGDGTPDSLSMAVGIHCVRAEF
jgi:hypothetical protein